MKIRSGCSARRTANTMRIRKDSEIRCQSCPKRASCAHPNRRSKCSGAANVPSRRSAPGRTLCRHTAPSPIRNGTIGRISIASQARSYGSRYRHSGTRDGRSSSLSRHAGLVRRVRTRFERLRPRRVRLFRQIDGTDVDICAYVTAAADRQAGVAMDGRLYVASRAARRELAVALLLDVSASTDAWVSANRRIVDVEKEAMLVVCEALDALGDRYALFGFSGEGPTHVDVLQLKGFEEPSSLQIRRRIAALDSDGYTRLGASIRHVTAALCRERQRRVSSFCSLTGSRTTSISMKAATASKIRVRP